MADHNLEDDFPNLNDERWEKTSEPAGYNCIAWSLYDTRQWWELIGVPVRGYYWPPGIERDDTIDSWISIFEIHGYRVCADAELEPDFEKVAIYVKDNKPEHVTRQLITGAWTSKLRPDEEITHSTLQCLAGEIYGAIGIVLKRRRRLPSAERP